MVDIVYFHFSVSGVISDKLSHCSGGIGTGVTSLIADGMFHWFLYILFVKSSCLGHTKVAIIALVELLPHTYYWHFKGFPTGSLLMQLLHALCGINDLSKYANSVGKCRHMSA